MNEMNKYDCMVCGKELPETYTPAMCCDGRECGCMGQPTNPPVCSADCYNKLPGVIEFNRFIGIMKECSDSPSSAGEKQ